jgi:hypothetical protein
LALIPFPAKVIEVNGLVEIKLNLAPLLVFPDVFDRVF